MLKYLDFKTKKMKNQNSKTKKRSTADLIVRHAERHLAKNPHIRFFTRFAGTTIFAFAGVCVLLTAFYLINSAESPAFIAENATDYAAQKAFYTAEEMHAAAEFAPAVQKIREVARATEISRALNAIGLILILAGFWYLHREHGLFANRAGFTIRRIR